MDNRTFSPSYKKHNRMHRWNPFNRILHKRILKLGADAAVKTIFTSPVLDQGQLPRCTAYCMCALRAAVTGRSYSTDQYWADEMSYENEPSGVDAHTAAAVSINPGWEFTPGSYEHADGIYWIYPNNGMDMMDSVNDAIRTYQSPAAVGLEWYSSWEEGQNGQIPTSTPSLPAGGHLTMICGPESNGTELNQNSWGTNAPGSDQGFYHFPRAIMNGYVEGYPCFIPYQSNDPLVKILGKLSATLVAIADLLSN